MLRLFNQRVLTSSSHTIHSQALMSVGVTSQIRGKKGRSKGPRKPPKHKPHRVMLPNVNLAKYEMEKTEGPRKNSWAYKANHQPVAYGWTPSAKANKKILAEKNKEMNPPGTSTPFYVSPRNQELIAQIHEAANAPTNPQAAIEAYHRMNAVPDAKIYTAIIKSFAGQKGYLGEAVQIYNDLKKQNVVAGIETYLALIECCAQDSHLPRAIFFLKEMLRARKNVKPSQKVLPIYFAILRLCYQLNNPSKALLVYRVMLEEGLFGLPEFAQTGDAYHRNFVPQSFVKQWLTNTSEEDVREFWIKINENIRYNFRESLEQKQPELSYQAIDMNDFHSTVRQSELQYQHIYEDTKYVTALDELCNGVSFKEATSLVYGDESGSESDFLSLPKELRNMFDPKFGLKPTYHFQDAQVDSLFQSAWENVMNSGAELFDQEVLRPSTKAPADPLTLTDLPNEFFVGLAPMARAAVRTEHHRSVVRQAYREHVESETEADFVKADESFSAYLKEAEFKHLNKIHWIPVIIGLDGEPFYPNNVGMHLLTEETVKSAKQQYLNSIEEEETRKQIAESMYDQILLRFLDPSTKKLIEGLYY